MDWTDDVNQMLEDGWELKDFKTSQSAKKDGVSFVVIGYLERVKTPKKSY